MIKVYKGLFGAPEIRVVVSDEVHVTVLKALSLLGLGRDRVSRVPTDERGRMRAGRQRQHWRFRPGSGHLPEG